MKSFLRPDDIVKLMGGCQSSAYNVIRMLNAELQQKGSTTRRGRVSTKYFCERFYIDPETIDRDLEAGRCT